MARIIVIDDSEAVRLQLKNALETAGHVVTEAVDGNDGYNKVVEMENPDLVITDYNMPGMNGVAMLDKIRKKLGEGKFPIFMLTTDTSDDLKAMGKKVGVNAWVNKSFSPEKFLAAVGMILTKKRN